MKNTRIGIIGAGLMGERHARVLRGIPEVELIGISDVDQVRGRLVADRHRAEFFESYAQLLAKVDAIAVATPTPLHYEQAKQALQAGVHVFVEKAFTQYVEQGEELDEMAKAKGLLLQVGHIERFNPVYTELKKIMREFKRSLDPCSFFDGVCNFFCVEKPMVIVLFFIPENGRCILLLAYSKHRMNSFFRWDRDAALPEEYGVLAAQDDLAGSGGVRSHRTSADYHLSFH